MKPFPKLFESFQIGPMRLRNRLVVAPFALRFATRDGFVTRKLIDHFIELGNGGAGLIITEDAYIDEKGSVFTFCQLGVYDDSLIPGLSELAESVHLTGAKIVLQLDHAGIERATGKPPILAPSAIAWEKIGVVAKELTIEEIEEIIVAFANACSRAKQTGFDGVEIHGAHGYLVSGFLSPYLNQRNDKYGGTFERRLKFPLEIIEAARTKVGYQFPIGFRISGDEFIAGGNTLEETKKIAKRLEAASVDWLHVSAGVHDSIDRMVPPMYLPRGLNTYLARTIKEEVKLPVITVGGINDPELANEIVERGDADLVAMGRALLADPYLPIKAKRGMVEDIRMCIRCNTCTQIAFENKQIRCAINPQMGQQDLFRLQPTNQAKKVLVIGGGPAGMEAARVAAMRGHRVTLLEKGERLGGQLLVASVPPFKAEIKNLIEYLSTQIRKLGVHVELGKEATVETIRKFGADCIILATGAVQLLPQINGIDQPITTTAIDVLRGKEVGDVVIIVGGGLVGCEVALFLAEKGKKVTILEMMDEVALDVETTGKMVLEKKFKEYDISTRAGVKVDEITEDGVTTIDKSWNREHYTADNVVIALGSEANSSLLEALESKDVEAYVIGDCKEPRSILEAIHEGAYVGLQV